mmetsp:Transcript_42763/g.89424  ORF Transcript_42763/g.89424 Transcript_42763/m.89424 type:complete len:318 (+) Transcript_42763:2288-3241(+)
MVLVAHRLRHLLPHDAAKHRRKRGQHGGRRPGYLPHKIFVDLDFHAQLRLGLLHQVQHRLRRGHVVRRRHLPVHLLVLVERVGEEVQELRAAELVEVSDAAAPARVAGEVGVADRLLQRAEVERLGALDLDHRAVRVHRFPRVPSERGRVDVHGEVVHARVEHLDLQPIDFGHALHAFELNPFADSELDLLIVRDGNNGRIRVGDVCYNSCVRIFAVDIQHGEAGTKVIENLPNYALHIHTYELDWWSLRTAKGIVCDTFLQRSFNEDNQRISGQRGWLQCCVQSLDNNRRVKLLQFAHASCCSVLSDILLCQEVMR